MKGRRESKIQTLIYRLKLSRNKWGKEQNQLKIILQTLRDELRKHLSICRKLIGREGKGRTNLGNVLFFTVTLTIH